MPNFVVNISLLFNNLPMSDRLQKAIGMGFKGVEILSPYDYAKEELLHASTAANCKIYLINTPFDMQKNDWGCAADPDKITEFQNRTKQAVSYGKALGVNHIHLMAGVLGNIETFKTNLSWAANSFKDQSFLIEPINTLDVPNYQLSDFTNALDILKQIDRANLGLQFDTYHASRIAEQNDLDPSKIISTYQTYQPWIKHIQVSGNPNRTEPDMGLVDHSAFFKHLDKTGYTGFVGAEYNPRSYSLDWLANA